jgi:hypothetical protein
VVDISGNKECYTPAAIYRGPGDFFIVHTYTHTHTHTHTHRVLLAYVRNLSSLASFLKDMLGLSVT